MKKFSQLNYLSEEEIIEKCIELLVDSIEQHNFNEFKYLLNNDIILNKVKKSFPQETPLIISLYLKGSFNFVQFSLDKNLEHSEDLHFLVDFISECPDDDDYFLWKNEKILDLCKKIKKEKKKNIPKLLIINLKKR